MTPTNSAFLPAASRAGTAEYSSDSSASRSSGQSSETRSFEELCPEEHGRRDAELHETTTDTAEHSPAEDDSAAPAEEATDTSVDLATGEAEGQDEGQDEGDDDDSTPRSNLPALVSPSLIQTILTSLREIAPVDATRPSQGAPAENAATASSAAPNGVSVRADGRSTSIPSSDMAASAATMHRQGRSARAGDGQRHEGAAPRSQPSAAASPRATDKDAATTASPISVAAKAKATPAEDSSAQPAIARLITTKGHAEKSAGQAHAAQVAQVTSGQNKFLTTDNQDVMVVPRATGTRAALSAGTMSSSTTMTPRHSESPVLATTSQAATGQGEWTETLSVDWKGWTNGGGERASTAAQFSQLGDKLGQVGIAATPATSAVARATTPVVPQAVPTAPTVPADAAEALAPIHSAIERLVLHGREQLALTVRFEQGGSLSIKLAMQQGEIATQIQTDVPGLEAALKSAWGELAQDWNSRGWKLAQPEFSSSAATYHQRDDATADGRDAGRRAREQSDEAPSFGSRAFSPARLKHAGGVTLSGLDALRAAAMARRGIHTWA